MNDRDHVLSSDNDESNPEKNYGNYHQIQSIVQSFPIGYMILIKQSFVNSKYFLIYRFSFLMKFFSLSLFLSYHVLQDSQTSTIDYIRNFNIRMGVPILCIPLFANDLLGPTVVGPNGLIRNIPGTGTPLQSSPDNNVSEEDYGEEDGSSSDIEESFPLDLTRSSNNNSKSKPMPIIPPISTGRRDSKAVKFLID